MSKFRKLGQQLKGLKPQTKLSQYKTIASRQQAIKKAKQPVAILVKISTQDGEREYNQSVALKKADIPQKFRHLFQNLTRKNMYAMAIAYLFDDTLSVEEALAHNGEQDNIEYIVQIYDVLPVSPQQYKVLKSLGLAY